MISDEIGAELCGALKNIVAIGAGLGEGLGYGEDTKAAIIRLGFMEMKRFIFQFFSKRCKYHDLLIFGRSLHTPSKISAALCSKIWPISAPMSKSSDAQSHKKGKKHD